jgi:hypothetical protein
MDTVESAELNQFKQRLEENYAYLRSVIQPGYTYHASPAFDKAFVKASKFCMEKGITPEEYAQGLMSSLDYDRKNCFYPTLFGSSTGNTAVLQYREEKSISFKDLYECQKALLILQITKLGKTPKEVLLNPRLQFYAWFRTLATAKPDYDIINTYSETAREEMTPELVTFLKEQNLDVDRII